MKISENKIDPKTIEKKFIDFLYKQKGKVTNERLSILTLLYQKDGHFSVDNFLELAQDQDIRVSRATVYRTLDLLVQAGLARKHNFEGQDVRFEAALKKGHHDHVICIDCGRITGFFDERLEKIQNDILSKVGLEHVKHIHQLYGRCRDPKCPYRPPLEGAQSNQDSK